MFVYVYTHILHVYSVCNVDKMLQTVAIDVALSRFTFI